MRPPVWYLPLSEGLADAMVGGQLPDTQKMSRYEVAATLFLQQLPKLEQQQPVSLERIFAQLITHHTDTLVGALDQGYDRGAFTRGMLLAPTLRVGLMDQASVDRRAYLWPAGGWNFDYGPSHRASLRAAQYEHVRPSGSVIFMSEHQNRLIQTIRANQDDSIDAQAHAGTGKTFVLAEILEVMGERKCLFLANTENKLKPIRKRFPEVWAYTFKAIAERSLAGRNRGLIDKLAEDSRRRHMYPELAEQLGLGAIGMYGPAQVAAMCWAIITKFCASADRVITARHIPYGYAQALSSIDQDIAASAAAKMWHQMSLILPHEPGMPVRGYHRIKQMDLSGEIIPEGVQTVIIDEGHDLTEPMRRILARSPQTVIILSDQFQNLEGSYVKPDVHIRHREMAVSLRAGPTLAEYVNELIEVYPHAQTEPYVADRSKDTYVAEYPAGAFPDEPCVILCSDQWGQLDWLIRNKEMGKGGALVDWDKGFMGFPQACLALFTSDIRSSHGALARYKSWDHLRNDLGWNHAFLRVEAWLENVASKRGTEGLFDVVDIAELSTKVPQRYLITTVFTAKNHELTRMALSEDLYYFNRMNSAELAKKLALIYTAITRVSGKVFLPDTHRDWLRHIISSATDYA